MPLDIFSWFRNYLLDIYPSNKNSKLFYKHEANMKIKVLWKHSLVFLSLCLFPYCNLYSTINIWIKLNQPDDPQAGPD